MLSANSLQTRSFSRAFGFTGARFMLIVPTVMFGVWHSLFAFGLVDDAFIPMTYARNVVGLHGIVFYPGGERVEGFTSPLWFLAMVLGELMGVSLPWLAYLLSMLFGLLTLWLMQALFLQVSSEASSENWAGVAGILLVIDISFPAWSSSGMETTLFAWLLLLMVWGAMRGWQAHRMLWVWLALTLTRPEGALLALAYPLLTYLRGGGFKRASGVVVLGVFLPLGLLTLFRLMYFGVPLPNTFYAKHDFRGIELWLRGADYAAAFFRPRLLFGLVLLWPFLEWQQSRRWMWAVLIMAALIFAIVVAEGGDHFALHRFLTPALPFLVIGLTRVVQRSWQRLAERHAALARPLVKAGFALFGSVALALYVTQLVHFKERDAFRFSKGAQWYFDEVQWTQNWREVGLWLKERYPAGTPIAVTTAGAIPYYSELPSIDIFGLNDPTIAHTPVGERARYYPGHEKSNADYVLAQTPVYIQLVPTFFFTSLVYPWNVYYESGETPWDRIESMLRYPAQKDIWKHPEFRRHYQFNIVQHNEGVIFLFERKGYE